MTTQTLTTYRIRYRRPNTDGPHGYEGPEFDMREITVTLCEEKSHNAYAAALVIGDKWQDRGRASAEATCDMCEHPGQGLLTIGIEKALGV